MSLKFTINGNTVSVPKVGNVYQLSYPCDDQTNCFPYETTLLSTCYGFEVWGAAGGTSSDRQPAKGGFSKGTLCLKTETKAFFYVGAKGISTTASEITKTAFNGGGAGKNVDHPLMSSGGGASDVRLIENSTFHRLIVAGGGGGSGIYKGVYYSGGSGGGNEGATGEASSTEGIAGTGGTFTTGGKTSHLQSDYIPASFGYGASIITWNRAWNGCGGGGGWYGGGAGYQASSGGGGGSGFAFTTSTCDDAISMGLKLSTDFLLTKAMTYSGNVEKYGNEENGKIFITLVKERKGYTCLCRQSIQSFVFAICFLNKS